MIRLFFMRMSALWGSEAWFGIVLRSGVEGVADLLGRRRKWERGGGYDT